jgi:hypothetical protein
VIPVTPYLCDPHRFLRGELLRQLGRLTSERLIVFWTINTGKPDLFWYAVDDRGQRISIGHAEHHAYGCRTVAGMRACGWLFMCDTRGKEKGEGKQTGEGGDSEDHRTSFVIAINRTRRKDWAGRAILQRWLGEGGDWNIDAIGGRNRDWKDYMMGNEHLQKQIYAELLKEVTPNVNDAGIGSYFVNRRSAGNTGVSSASISGYGYLHGTDKTVGGLEMSGIYWVQKVIGGGYVVSSRLTFTWNDKINENGCQDFVAASLGELISLGAAESYRIAITWDSMTGIYFNAAGTPITSTGYPGFMYGPLGPAEAYFEAIFPPFHWPPEYQR